MNILIIAKNNTLPALKYGGTERVIWSLGKMLVESGHQVSYLVQPGSECNFAKIIPYDPEKDLNSQIPKDIEVVHFQDEHEEIEFPNLITIHGNAYDKIPFHKNAVFLSKNHAYRHSSETYVYNGLDWNDYPSHELTSKREYLHFLGKATWKVKNFSGAVKIALNCKHDLHVLGGTKWSYRNLKRNPFSKINPRIKYHGMVDNLKKMQIMNNSKGLVFPVRWHEPFGLAIIESLYAGCPVFGSSYGSLPELVTNDVGITNNDSSIIENAILNNEYSPNICRDYAIERFNAKVMTNEYLKLYEKVIKGEDLNNIPPVLRSIQEAEILSFK